MLIGFENILLSSLFFVFFFILIVSYKVCLIECLSITEAPGACFKQQNVSCIKPDNTNTDLRSGC